MAFGVGMSITTAIVLTGWILPVFGVAFAAWGFHLLRIGRAAQRTHAALQALRRGRPDEAEAHPDATPAPPAPPSPRPRSAP